METLITVIDFSIRFNNLLLSFATCQVTTSLRMIHVIKMTYEYFYFLHWITITENYYDLIIDKFGRKKFIYLLKAIIIVKYELNL